MKKWFFALLLLNGSAFGADIASFGGLPDGSDTTPAWNSAIASAQVGPDRTVTFGQGVYSFHTRPNAITQNGVTVCGTGPWTTSLKRTYSPVVVTEPFIELQGRGSEICKLEILTAVGTVNGYGLFLFTDNSTLPGGKHQLRFLRISGEVINGVHDGRWRVALYLKGDTRTVKPIGLREVNIYQIEIFDSTQWLTTWWGTVSSSWFGGSAVQGGGVAKGIAVGGTNSTLNRIDANVDWLTSSVAAGSMRGPGR